MLQVQSFEDETSEGQPARELILVLESQKMIQFGNGFIPMVAAILDVCCLVAFTYLLLAG